MAGPASQRLTADQYLEYERAAETKHEFFDGRTYAMAGVSHQHDRATFNLTVALGIALRGNRCQGFTSDMRVLVRANGLFTYPDAYITCDKPDFFDSSVDTLTNPKMIFEVLSKSTERYDRGPKFRLYQQCESITDIVFIAQTEVYVEHFHRLEGGSWEYRSYATLDSAVPFEDIDVSINLGDIYEDVEFETPQAMRSESD